MGTDSSKTPLLREKRKIACFELFQINNTKTERDEQEEAKF